MLHPVANRRRMLWRKKRRILVSKTKKGKIVLKSKADRNVLTRLAMMDKSWRLLRSSAPGSSKKRSPLEETTYRIMKRRCCL